jgi:hypothetical protein
VDTEVAEVAEIDEIDEIGVAPGDRTGDWT